MGKIVKTLLLPLIFVTLLFGSGLSNEIVKESKLVNSSSKDSSVRLYHNLKNLYIKAIINDDKPAQIEAIKALIKISKILKLPYKHYEKELALLTPKRSKKIKKAVSKKVSSKVSLARVRSIASFKDRVVITFNKNIDKKDISFYELNAKDRYRDIFDIKAKLFFKVRPIKIKGIKHIRVSQYKKDTLRVVLESTTPINSTLSIERDKAIVKIYNDKKVAKRVFKKRLPIKSNYTNKYFSPIKAGRVVILDPGHGGKDTGAIGYKRLREKDAVLKIAKKVGKYLKKYGFKVYYTRYRDIFIKLRNRTHYANLKKADIFISIHANAAPKRSQYLLSKGVETYFLSPARSARAKRVSAIENSVDIGSMDYYSKQVFLNFLNREKIVSSNKLAIDIQRGILKSVRRKYSLVDDGVRKAPFWVLVGAQMPAVLVETGYITNPTEAKRLFNPYYEDLLAKGIANGVVSYFEKNR